MSQMPDKIWLHKDTKYSTGDIVCGYQYDFVQGIEYEGGIKNFVKYIPADVFIDKACEFLKSYRQDTPDGYGYIAGIVNDKTIEDFRKYMEGE